MGYIIPVILAAAVLLFFLGYLKAPPDTAYVISGLGKRRILIGKAGWRFPFLERVDKLPLNVMQVDVKTSEAVPTNEFINVSVDGVANIKISSKPELLNRAAESLLCCSDPDDIVRRVAAREDRFAREMMQFALDKQYLRTRKGAA